MNKLELPIFEDPIFTTVILFFIIVVIMVIYVTQKLHYISRLRKNLESQDQTIADLDQQAKLIIKSDMELKLYQQEIEDKLTKLTLIKELIVASMNVLNKEELFSHINERLIHALGFNKGILITFEDLTVVSNIGFTEHQTNELLSALKYKKEIFKDTPLVPTSSELFQQLAKILHTKEILVAAIKLHEYIHGIFLVAQRILPADIKKSDEEAFLIVCMQLSQCLDKIKLFEGLYHTKDNLEKKIKERTNELVKSLRAIEVISKAKSDFISSVSHELRTPLTSIKGFSSLLVEEKFGKLPEEARKRLITIDENVNKLMDIVNTLLDIARIESGKMEVKIAPAEIVELLNGVAELLAPQIQAKKIKLSLSTPKTLQVYMDKSLIERVLINLINNAIKYTPEGGSILVSLRQIDQQALIGVKDTGCGIKQEDLEKIFDEFYRVNNPENVKLRGSGLGLSLVRKIIDTHKEKIWVESEVGKGSSFYFTLRVVKNG